MLLADKVAVITGGAKGIGRGIALKFAEEGCNVAIADVSLREAIETLDGVSERGREGLIVECDITSGNKVQSMVNEVMVKFGKIDILVNNAGSASLPGFAHHESLADISEEEWDRIIAINLKGAFLCCKEVVPHMKRQGHGTIINISSLGAVHPPAVHTAYHAAKAGILGLTYDAARELGPFGVRVNAIMPGPIRTPFYEPILQGKTEEERAAFFAELGQIAPLKRMGDPEDIAGAALFLASELSAYVTAAVLPVTGGLPLQPSP